MFQNITIFILNRHEYDIHKDFLIDHPIFRIEYGNIFNSTADCFITAGQSFGMMVGGIDGDTNYFFGMIDKQIQDIIIHNWYGEIPVGVSIVLNTSHNKNFKYLCYSPTMRVPSDVSNSINAYLAFRGALVECAKYNIKSICTPLL